MSGNARRRIALVLAAGLVTAGCGTVQPSASWLPVTPALSPASPSGTPGATDSPSSSASPTASATSETAVVLAGTGLAGMPFGTAEEEVEVVLADRLGKADDTYEGVLCELDSNSPWARTLTFDGLWVQFQADGTTESAPRTLEAWGFILDKPFKEPLVMADGVPVNLTFAQLRAKYPDGTLERIPLGDDEARIFTLPNGIRFVGSASGRPDMVSAGEMGFCE